MAKYGLDFITVSVITTDLRGDRVQVYEDDYITIPSFPNYEISQFGNVRRIGKVFPMPKRYFKTETYHTTKYQSRPIHKISLFKNGKRCTVVVQDLMEEVFNTRSFMRRGARNDIKNQDD